MYSSKPLRHLTANPARINADTQEWLTCMRRDIAALIECDGIVLLPRWEWSRGAILEHDIALRLGLQIFLLEQLYEAGPIRSDSGKHNQVYSATSRCQRG